MQLRGAGLALDAHVTALGNKSSPDGGNWWHISTIIVRYDEFVIGGGHFMVVAVFGLSPSDTIVEFTDCQLRKVGREIRRSFAEQ
jgi:hypothetical protein